MNLQAKSVPPTGLITWLIVCCVLIFAMVVLGGVTRLTHSGLSMVEWEPIMGVIPPLSQTQWEETFSLYKRFPEYQYVNKGMSLTEFKTIFYFEYAHRLLGRLIGFVFFLPLVYFAWRKIIDRGLGLRLFGIFILGGLQGLLGWYMVKSGLVNEPHVSQYRLTAHLLLAFALYGLILWSVLSLIFVRQTINAGFSQISRSAALLFLLLVVLMVASGGFVAGTRAGFIMNTFPKMGADWIPGQLFVLSPIWRNFFENTITIQFFHRIGAYTTAIFGLYLAIRAIRFEIIETLRKAGWFILIALCLQIALGISTLLLKVPVALAAAHQGGALILFTATLVFYYLVERHRP